MPIDPLWIWIAVGAVAVLVVAGLFARGSRRARTAQLRDTFGPEYDHLVRETGKRDRAERELLARVDEIKQFDIRPLTAAERERFHGAWSLIEKRFLERPTTAVAEADELVADMMRVRGYPMGDFEKHAANLSVTHPRVVEHYRAGHRIISAKSSTEELRQAMLHYRSLFDELVGEGRTDVEREIPLTSETRPSQARPERRESEPLEADRPREGNSR